MCEKDNMIDYYLSGLSAKESANKCGFSESLCLKELKKRGIAVRTMKEYSIIAMEKISEDVISRYLAGHSINKISLELKKSSAVCRKILVNNNIAIHGLSLIHI